MLPVACLPVAGILMGIGYALSPHVMQGGDITGTVEILGFFLIKAGAALIDNMSWLFAIGVAVGMADDKDGTAGLAGLVSWLMMTTLLSSDAIAIMTQAKANVAFGKIQNQFIGILAGIIGSVCYNKFKNTKLPDALAFFSGKRSVAIVTAMVSVVVSGILFFIWPVIYGGLIGFGKSIVSLGAVGAGIYAFFNRLLIPFGLHHALNSVFWFDAAGINDLGNFWGNTGTAGTTGMYMSGFFPCMMFGLPAAAFAMIRSAKPEKKKYAVFRFAIVTFNLKTPGREDDADNAEEMKAVLANGDFTEVAKIILEGLGGKENVASVDNCITRLRIEVKDYTAVDEKKIKSAGVAGIIRPSKTSVQVVIGPKVQFVADEVNRLM